jgi:hypothetical protein
MYYCSTHVTESNEKIEPITFDELYEQKIFNFVDKNIALISKVYWYNSKILWDRTSDTSFASQIKLKFENGDNYISDDRCKNQNRGDIFLVSEKISKKIDENLVEKYYDDDDSLSNLLNTYILEGKVQFRDWINISEELLKDSVFIKQCNNVVYWSQTFEFNAERILKEY